MFFESKSNPFRSVDPGHELNYDIMMTRSVRVGSDRVKVSYDPDVTARPYHCLP